MNTEQENAKLWESRAETERTRVTALQAENARLVAERDAVAGACDWLGRRYTKLRNLFAAANAAKRQARMEANCYHELLETQTGWRDGAQQKLDRLLVELMSVTDTAFALEIDRDGARFWAHAWKRAAKRYRREYRMCEQNE